MGTSLILAASIAVQFAAAFLSLRLIPVTGRRRAWIAISMAIFLMGIRRSMTLYETTLGGRVEASYPAGGGTEWVTLVISALMLAGIAWIAPLFQSINRSTAALRESEARFRTLAETIPTPIFICCQAERIRYVNPSAEAVSGYTKDELLAMHFEDLIHPDFHESFEGRDTEPDPVESACFRQEAMIVTKEGENRWLDLSTAAFEFEGLSAVLVSARDTTRHREAERELERYRHRLEELVSERTAELMETVGCLQGEIDERVKAEEAIERLNRRHRLILESVGAGVFELDMNKAFTFVNASASRMLGWSPHELTGRCVYPLIHHSTPDGSHYPTKECSTGRVHVNGSSRHANGEVFRRKDGISFPVELVSIPIHNEEGRQVSTVVTFNDITERKRAEDVMRNERERFSVILDGNPIPSFVIGRDHRVVVWNRACELLTGAPRDDVLGRPVDSGIFYPGPPRPVLADLVLDMGLEAMEGLYGGRRFDRSSFHPEAFEATDLLTLGGRKRNVYFLAARLKDANGEIIGAIETLQDITDHIELQRQLRQTQKMEAIGTLAGGIAHDFNNILTAIIGYAEMALDDLPVGDKTSRSLGQVLKAGRRAKDLVGHMLTFSRQDEQARQPVRASQIVREALHFLRASLPSTIAIRERITSDSALVPADPTQIHQVLMNLCSNAAHAMRETGGELEVSLAAANFDPEDFEPALLPGPYVKLTVKDTGHGMEREVMDRIFDPYFTTKGPGEGTGMGLSVVHGIVANHGGSIGVRSKPGVGTTFEVFIPRIDHAPESNESEACEPLPVGTEQILLVDDEEIIVEMEQLMLERLGYQVTATTGSLEALEAFRAAPGRFDLVITDQTMPNMTGAELCKKLLSIRPDIPIILCTGFSDLVTPEKAQAMGIGAFMRKPPARRELARAIRRLLDEGERGSP